MVEPEVVATSPCRIKSPVPVCCGFDSVELVLAAGVAPALATLSTSCLCSWTTRGKWILQPVLPRQNRFTKAIHRLLHGGEWSPSPVLPRTRRAYETHLSAGSTAEMEPPPGMGFPSPARWMPQTESFASRIAVHRADSLYRANAPLKVL